MQIEYKGKGYFSGKTHTFKAAVTGPGGAGGARHTVEGQWHTTSKDGRGALFTNVQGPKEEVSVRDVEAQDAWESRRLWRRVARGIREGDFETASREKSKIEVSRGGGRRAGGADGGAERAAAAAEGRGGGGDGVGAEALYACGVGRGVYVAQCFFNGVGGC